VKWEHGKCTLTPTRLTSPQPNSPWPNKPLLLSAALPSNMVLIPTHLVPYFMHKNYSHHIHLFSWDAGGKHTVNLRTPLGLKISSLRHGAQGSCAALMTSMVLYVQQTSILFYFSSSAFCSSFTCSGSRKARRCR